jgi:GAF domain-containing protein
MNTQSIERQAKLLNAAARVAKNITSILDLNLLLQRTVDIICEEFGFYYAGVFLADESGEWAVLKAGRGEAGSAMLADGHKLHIGGNSMIGNSIAQRQARIALDVGAEAVFFKNPHLPLTRSEMALPLIAGDEIIGAVTVQSEEEAAFSKEDIAALQTMADQLAVAISNAYLHQKNHLLLRQAERRARLLRAANQVGKEVASILNLDELLPKMVDTIVDAYGFYYAGIFLTDASGGWATLSAGYGEAGRDMLKEGHKLQVGGKSMIGTAIRLNEPRVAFDVGEERVHFKNPRLPNTRSEMALPIAYGDDVLGAVTIQSVEERAFSPDDISTLQTMAEHLAVAITNARALAALKAAHAELVRTKVFEALTGVTTDAIHWIGNKALPMTITVRRMKEELVDGAVDTASLAEDLDLIAESANQIIQIKEQLIGAAREQKPRPAMISDLLRAAAIERGVPLAKIQMEIGSEAAFVIADTTQLTRAFGNLLQNAAEANAAHIRIETQLAPENSIQIVISDDGWGINAEILEKIWTPFYTSKGPGHYGLGLPATLHVISQIDGSIKITSEVGQGTRVEINLPRASVSAAEDYTTAPQNILLIDDDDAWAGFICGALKIAGKNIVRRADAEIDPAADLILVDEHLEALPLATVLDAVKKAGVAAKTRIVTAAMNVDRVTPHLRKVSDVVLKPYAPAEIPSLWGK